MHEFLEVLGQVRVWNRKSAGRARVGMVCGGRVWVRSGQDFSNSFGCGAGLNFAGARRERAKISTHAGLYLW